MNNNLRVDLVTNPFLLFILFALIGGYLFDLILDCLDLRSFSDEIPPDFQEWYDPEKYAWSRQYFRTKVLFGIVSATFFRPLTLAFILLGGFATIDRFVATLTDGTIVSGLIFTGTIVLLNYLLHLPFDYYHTFVIEERFGFNRTTRMTFLVDQIKGLVLMAIIGGGLLVLVIWLFDKIGQMAWLWSAAAVFLVQLFLVFIAPVVILPLFNKFKPLEDELLKNSIESIANKHDFAIKGIFVMDGSKRSAKANAYLIGFGRFKRIVLFDTLLAVHHHEEILAVLAHEIGHHKNRHIIKNFFLVGSNTLLMFYLLSLFIASELLFEAFSLERVTLYAGLIFFGFLYSPIARILSFFTNFLSRRFEYEADAFAANEPNCAKALIDALKRLSVENLSNLAPHPLRVLLDYSHPPVLQRIARLKERVR